VTLQTITSDARKHSYMDNIKLMGIETALGYSNIEMNVLPSLWPQNEEDEWQKLSKEEMSNVATYWSPYSYFDATTISQSDERVRCFLNLNYNYSRKGDTIELNSQSHNNDVYYILRTHDERIVSTSFGEYKQLEKNVYLIKTFASLLDIKLEKVEDKD
ncbi:MAG: hypothetical protein J6S38_06815, partial [Erysipelotrichaceae bacterium]|nr:hypothetical protein [Erysipelotrichaceae bacterium]